MNILFIPQWSSGLGSRLWTGRSRDRGSLSHFLFNRTFTQGLKIIGEKAFHLAYAAYLGPLVHPPTGPASRVAVHMGSLSLAHPMLGQDAPQMPDGNALALFNDFGYDIPEMSSNISRYLVTIAQRAPGVSCTPVGTGGRAALVRG